MSRQSLLPPANEVWEGYVFTQVSVCPQRGVAGGAFVAGVCAWKGGCVWQGGVHGRRDICDRGGVHGRGHAWHVHHPEHPPPSNRHYEIWSMSGRYASYWNAFLLKDKPSLVLIRATSDKVKIGIEYRMKVCRSKLVLLIYSRSLVHSPLGSGYNKQLFERAQSFIFKCLIYYPRR